MMPNVSSDYRFVDSLLDPSQINHIHSEISDVIDSLASCSLSKDTSLTHKWFSLIAEGRNKGASLYNILKGLPSILSASSGLCSHPVIQQSLHSPVVIDINARIDSYGEEHYLFDWHQDFWFLMASRFAKVVWIPLLPLTPSNGGIKLASQYYSPDSSFVLPIRPSLSDYLSYSSSLLLRDSPDSFISNSDVLTINNLSSGDGVIFDFLTPHASINVPEPNQVRLTLQVRLGDLTCPEFISSGFKKCTHTRTDMAYLSFIDDVGFWNGKFPA